jgi:hypothetical protein
MKKWLTSGLLRTILLALLTVSFVPFGLIAYAGSSSFAQSKDEVIEKSSDEFNRQSFENLRSRAIFVAQDVARFLREREADLAVAASLPRDEQAFVNFSSAKVGTIWTITTDGTEVRQAVPLYREVAFIDLNGREVIKITNRCEAYPFSCRVESSRLLTNVSDPQNTLYKAETYFSEAVALQEGQVYVGGVIGEHIPQERAYAGAQNRTGERYRGVIRFAAPVFEDGKKVGVVVLAVESIHLIELVNHISPANPEPIAEIDPREADFTYLVNPEGWAISHPRHFNIIGVDETGQLVPGISDERRDDPDNLYRPGNLTEMGFIAPELPEMVRHNQRGDSGTLQGRVWQGPRRAFAYATIPYYTGGYNSPAGFGMVVMSTDSERFNLPSDLLGKQIQNRSDELILQMQSLSVLALGLSIVLAVVLARSVAWPVLRLTDSAQMIQEEKWDKAKLDELAKTRGSDEVARLSRVFASMASNVRSREIKMRQEIKSLQIVIEESKVQEEVSRIADTEFFQDLTAKARQMRAEKNRRAADTDSTNQG